MAKKAPILSKNYNPVGEKLRRVLETAAETSDAPLQPKAKEPAQVVEKEPSHEVVPESVNEAPAADNIVELPKQSAGAKSPHKSTSSKNAMTSELRCRCTKSERKKWHDFAMRVTGAPNQFSHVFRAMLLLLEHAEKELEKQNHKLEVLENPSKQDPLAVTFYEQKLASFVWEALRRAGRPESY